MLPIFKSHYSVGRSILTLEDKDELESTSPDSIISICLNHKIKKYVYNLKKMEDEYYDSKKT